MPIYLEIKNLKAGYNGGEILHNVDFKINSGEIVVLIGPNGAGKSTLLKSIFNLTEIYSGEIIFENKTITKLPTHQLIHKGISYVPQGRQVFPNLTVRENLEMGGFVIEDKALIEKNIQNIFNKFPVLRERKNEIALNLSGGEQQMLAIGRALIQNPKLLLLDEPSLGLSPKMIKQVFEKIKEINKHRVSIIIVEQNVKKAMEIADKVYIMKNGKKVFEGKKEILQDKKTKNIYFGDE